MLYGKNFETTDGFMNYDAALALCKSQENDVTVPLPNSNEENQFIRSLLQGPNGHQYCWLGITDEEWDAQ